MSTRIQDSSLPGKLGIIQRIVPTYRKPFFDTLALRCQGGLEVFCGLPHEDEGIRVVNNLDHARLIMTKNISVGHIEKNAWALYWQRDIVNWLQIYDPDVLVVQMLPRMLSSWIAIQHMKKQGKPVLGWGLGELPAKSNNLAQRIRRSFVHQMLRTLDGVISYSSKGARDYVSFGVRPECIVVAHNAVDNSTASAMRKKIISQPDLTTRWKQAIFGDANVPIVLFVGRLLPQKRVDLLIRACAQQKQKCHLVIVGDGPERTILEEVARDHFPETVFLGYKAGEELGTVFMACDVFVLPGTGGLAIQEAMSYGKPVIVADGDGTEQDLVRPGKNGYLIPSGDLDALSQYLTNVLHSPLQLVTMGQESLRIVEQEININKMADAFFTAIHSAESRVIAGKS